MPDTADSFHRRRVAGVTVPLFSLRSARSWGIGEIGDLPEFAAWVASAGIKLVQILPLGEISGGETSPYSALTAFGIDPMYISIADIEDLPYSEVRDALGGDVGLALLERAKASERVDYGAVRFVKQRAIRYAFERFMAREHGRGSVRAEAFDAFVEVNSHWLEDYALFRALKESHGGKPWWEWSSALRAREPEALAEARARLRREVSYFEYVQWLAHTQWEAAREKLRAIGVEVMGDLPFMVGRDSADVWANQREFRDDASVGVPGDQFNEEGQDWGLPPYDWQAMRANDFAWLRRRARYAGSLYDRFRIDHLVGFYRTYMRPRDRRVDERGRLVKGVFDPPDEGAQLAHGERVISAMVEAGRERGAELIAEDLGVIPDFVRPSLARLGVPGYKVLIWEKDGAVFRDPRSYPVLSVACFGTHDTDPLPVWWEGRDEAERAALLRLPQIRDRRAEMSPRFTLAVQRALFDLINAAPSELVLYLVQDLLGSRERINTPATTGPQNWTYRLPGTVHEMQNNPVIAAAMASIRESIERSGRA